MTAFSRRSVLWLFGGGVAVLGLGYAGVRSFSDTDLVRGVLERYFGSLTMAEEDLQAFVADFRERGAWRLPTSKLADASTLLEKLRVAPAVRDLLPQDDQRQLEQFERWLLADFYQMTDFAWRESPTDPVHFTGSQGCVNPFAKFEPVETT